MFGNIKSIKHFHSAYELIDYMECIGSLGFSDDEIDYLASINDYDDFGFFLINGDTVIISDYFGDVSGSAMSYDEFLKNTLEYVKENA